MSSDNDKKRKLDAVAPIADGTATCEMMAEMKAMFHEKMTQMERKLARVDELEGRCKYLEDRCGSMERSLKALAARWVYSAPDIPASHWTEQGFDEEYAATADELLGRIRRSVSMLKKGSLDLPCIGNMDADDDERVLAHDDALLPHWQNLADALDLYGPTIDKVGGSLWVSHTQLVPKVLALLTPPLTAVKKFTEIRLYRNDFPRACDGMKFAVELIQSSPNLGVFQWVGNPLDTIDDANCLVEAIKSRPYIRSVRLEDCSDANSSVSYLLLTSLLSGNTAYASIDLDSNNIRTMGGTHISGYLATNPSLKDFFLSRNKLDDNDARLIADALKQNTNLTYISMDGNEITNIGRDALANAIFDMTSLNSAAESNHTCRIRGVFGAESVLDNIPDPLTNRRDKIYHLLSARNKEEANVHHLDMEFDDDDESLKFVPRVLESVYCAYNFGHRNNRSVLPLSIFFELLRGWKMPSLYENGKE